ncbi:MAG: trypsin-like peptidase domain-containing protein [Gemmatimonadetes bacterium]|nr:trypsin-like peptidase domain-containing protein [Gemmatimonadota bacterium]
MDTVLYLGVDLGATGSVIGGHYDGMLKVYQAPTILSRDVLVAWNDAVAELGLEMLHTAGYPVRAPSRLFSNFEEVQGVGAVLAGEAVSLTADTYGRLAGDHTTVALTVRWELYDPATRRVTYSRSTSAEVSTSGISADAFRLAFTSSLSQMLADAEFRESTVDIAFRGPINSSRETPGNTVFHRVIPQDSELIALTSSSFLVPSGESPFERVGPAVVSLRGNSALGSAFMISRDGLALTNHHVVDGQLTLAARFPGGRERPARVIRTNKEADIALIEVACDEDCWTVSLDDEHPAVGSDLFVIGTPLTESLSHTMTRGIVSGLRLYSGVTLIQTDAAVNPGNSGAPMVDAASSRVLGIVTSKLIGEQIEGISFGVAIDDALRVVGVVVNN